MMATGLEPRWASPPGATIASVLAERDISTPDFGRRVGLQEEEVRRLLAGDLPITVDLARRLAQIVGATTNFWLTREAQFLEDRARVDADLWSRQLPIQQMAAFGWVDKPKTWKDRIALSLEFFGVSSVEAWEEHYDRQVYASHYRTSPTYELDPLAATVWLRAGERLVKSRGPIPQFDHEAFAAAIPRFRQLTRRRDPELFIPELVATSATCGVHVAVVRAPSGCPASGASRIYDSRPLIQLSARYLTDDHFWFTFFHEVGHVLNHHLDRGFLDILESTVTDEEPAGEETGTGDELEQEANAFATGCLLGEDAEHVLARDSGRWSHRSIIREAVRLGIAPGILVAQLQNAGVIPRSHFNRLKRTYAWDLDRLVPASHK
jgi:plasmid maintenance system antidote protein VapI